MAKKTISLLIFIALAPSLAVAQVVVSEIMYDVSGSDTDREWIEITNTGSESITITDWKLFEGNSNHGLVSAQGGETLSPGAYAVIVDSPVKFAADWPAFSGMVLDSSFSLNNTGEALALRCCGKDLSDKDSVTYNATGGGNGDGLSLHRTGSNLVSGSPSPGNGSISSPPPAEQEEEKDEPEPVIQKVEEKKAEEKKTDIKQEEKTEVQTEARASAIAEPTVVVQEEKPVAPKTKKKKVVEPIQEEFEEDGAEESSPEEIVSAQVAAAESAAPEGSDWMWWASAGGLSLLGAAGAYAMGRSQRREWKIEDISETE